MFFEYYYYYFFGDDAKKCHISDAKKRPFFDYLKDNYSVKLQHSQKNSCTSNRQTIMDILSWSFSWSLLLHFVTIYRGKLKKQKNNLNYCVSIWNNLFVIEKKKNTMKMMTAVKCKQTAQWFVFCVWQKFCEIGFHFFKIFVLFLY